MGPSAPPARPWPPQTPLGPPKHVASVTGSKSRYGSSVELGSGPHVCPTSPATQELAAILPATQQR